MSTTFLSPFIRPIRSLLGEERYYKLVDAYWQRRGVDPRLRISKRRLYTLHNKHKGERCFIIGNGPSLNNTDKSLLKDEVTFGLNRIYLLFDKVGFATTYYVSVNQLVIEQCAQEIQALQCPKFISWRSRNLIDFTDDMMFLQSGQVGPRFFHNIVDGVWEGATVTYVAMQIAYYLGFDQVILIGVDHSFTTKGEPHKMVVSQGDDPNHFAPHYFGKGFKWHLPDLETSELAYRIADYTFKQTQREIVDATIGGKLQVFRKVDYETLF
jgi:hypothetical protein